MLNLAYVIFGEHFDPLKQKNFAFKNILRIVCDVGISYMYNRYIINVKR